MDFTKSKNYSSAKIEVNNLTNYAVNIIKLKPYKTEDVHKAPSKKSCNAVSTFVGGGGS